MAINPETQYPGKITPGSADYPYGAARNITTPGDGTGTPWEQAIVNDLFGLQQALLTVTGVVPSGTPDKANASQYLEAIQRLSGAVFGDKAAVVSNASRLKSGMLVTTLGRDALGDGKGAVYRVTTGTAVPFKDIDLGGGLIARWLDGIGALTGRQSDVEFKAEDKYLGTHRAITTRGAVMIIGDSITEGVGATDYESGYADQFMRSLWRSIDGGVNEDRGYRYETIFNMANALAQTGVSSDGSITGGGIANNDLTLAAGQSITITGREIAFADIYYNATSSTATAIDFALNGDNYDSKAPSGSGTQSTFPTEIITGQEYIKDTDTVTITAVGGTVVITGLLTLRVSGNSTLCYVNGVSGWGYQDHALQARVDAAAEHINFFGPTTETAIILNLGTNNIYNPGKALSPSAYVAAIDDLINKYATALTKTVDFVISVPPQAAPGTDTVTGDPYLAYVDAIIEYAQANQRQLLRLDKTGLSGTGTFLDDTIHPNDKGHNILAKELARTMGIPFDSRGYKTTLSTPPVPAAAVVVEANNQLEEDAAFAAGALAVIRLDLIGPRSSLFMNFENPPTFEDLSEFAHPITVIGSPSITDSVPAPAGTYVADLRGAANFLTVNDDPSLRLTGGSTGWGIELYHRIDVTNVSNFLVSKGTQGVLNDGWYLALLWDGSTLDLTFVGKDNSTAVNVPYPYAADTTNFHHISVNSDGSIVRVYIDGGLFTSFPEPDIFEGSGPLYIGSWTFGTANTAGGYMDQLTISNDGPLRSADFTPPTGA